MANVIGYGGAAGGGKTDALLMAGIIAGLTYPGINIAFFRRTYPELAGLGGAIQRSQELMSGWAKWNGEHKRWTFPTGSRLQFLHCQDEGDVYAYQSQQFDVLLIDEATHFTRFQYRYLITRNRATQPGVTPFAALATNPGNIGHGWFKAEFIDVGPFEEPHRVEVEPGEFETHMFIPAKLADNRVLEQRDPEYRRRLEAQPEIIRRQLLEGDWSAFAGQVFSEWRYDLHVIPPFEIPSGWRRWRALDWGYAKPFAVLWFTKDPDGLTIVYRELYGCRPGEYDVGVRLDAYEVGKRIVEIEREAGEQVLLGYADPACWSKQGHEGPTIAESLAKAGAVFQPADNDRMQGIAKVHELLRIREDGLPQLVTFSTCVNLIRTLPALPADEAHPEDVDTDAEDHCYDALRYGLLSRVSPAKPEKPRAPKPKNRYTNY